VSDVILYFAFYFFNDSLTNEMFEKNMLFTEVDRAYWIQTSEGAIVTNLIYKYFNNIIIILLILFNINIYYYLLF